MSFGRLKFVASEYLQNSTISGIGVIGGYKSSSQTVKFDNPTLALNVNDRLVVRSSVTGDIGNQVTLIGRDSGGVTNAENVNLNGTGYVTGSLTFRHLLRVNAPAHSGEVYINKLSNNSGLVTISSGHLSLKNLFDTAVRNTTTYEKIFLENTSNTNALLNAQIYETTNSEGAFSFALATSKNDTETVANMFTSPTGVTVFTNQAITIPGGYLNTGECIGVWIKFEAGNNLSAPYGLRCAGSFPSLIEIDPTGNEGGGSPPPGITGAGLLQSGDIVYSGSFRFPNVGIDYSYGGGALSYNPNNDSLFFVGHVYYQELGEMTIPSTLVKMTGGNGYNQLGLATFIQGGGGSVFNRTPVYSGVISNDITSSHLDLYGTLVIDNKLIAAAAVFYDANYLGHYSHFSINPYDITGGTYSGLYQLGYVPNASQGGYLGGWMGTIPLHLTGVFRSRYFTGLGNTPIIGRSSSGPAFYTFNPHNLVGSGLPMSGLMHYTLSHPLRSESSTNPVFNTTSYFAGAVFPDLTNTFMVIGRHGTGTWCYGEASECGDLCGGGKGQHAYPYRSQVWAYAASGMIQTISGLRENWDHEPYAIFELPVPQNAVSQCMLFAGVAWDSGVRRLFVSQSYLGQYGEPVVHVFKVGVPSGT